MYMMTNCPNCGAPITGRRCEYCGTVFSENTTEIDELIDDLISDCNEYSKKLAIEHEQALQMLATLMDEMNSSFIFRIPVAYILTLLIIVFILIFSVI